MPYRQHQQKNIQLYPLGGLLTYGDSFHTLCQLQKNHLRSIFSMFSLKITESDWQTAKAFWDQISRQLQVLSVGHELEKQIEFINSNIFNKGNSKHVDDTQSVSTMAQLVNKIDFAKQDNNVTSFIQKPVCLTLVLFYSCLYFSSCVI